MGSNVGSPRTCLSRCPVSSRPPAQRLNCLRHTRDDAKKATSRPDIVQVFLKPDTAEAIREWSAHLGEEARRQITVYRDEGAALAKAFGIPDGYRFHGEVVHFPALVLLDPAGREVFRHVGKDNTDRLGFEKLSAKVDELNKAAAAGTPKSPTNFN